MSAVQETEATPNTLTIDLSTIKANTANSRGMGVLSNLKLQGYGLFNKEEGHDDKEPIWAMLMSPKADIRKEAVQLIQENEGHIVDLAESTGEIGQLQNIVVVESKTEPGTYDVVGGMRRAIALAFNHALDPKAPRTVEVKLMPYKTPKDLLLMSLDENNNREGESPIDRAITYAKLRDDHGMKPDEIAKRQGLSAQAIRNVLKMLDPKLEDKVLDIHTGELTIDKALKLLNKRKGTDNADAEDESTKEKGKRARMPSVKKLSEAYRAKQKPKWMEQKHWEMFSKDDVRRLFSQWLQIKFTPFSGELVTVEKEAPAKKKGAGKKAGFKYTLPRSLAVKLLAALGVDKAEGLGDSKIKEKLEGIVNIVEEGQTIEDPKLNTILQKLVDNYAKGLNVTIKPSPAAKSEAA